MHTLYTVFYMLNAVRAEPGDFVAHTRAAIFLSVCQTANVVALALILLAVGVINPEYQIDSSYYGYTAVFFVIVNLLVMKVKPLISKKDKWKTVIYAFSSILTFGCLLGQVD